MWVQKKETILDKTWLGGPGSTKPNCGSKEREEREGADIGNNQKGETRNHTRSCHLTFLSQETRAFKLWADMEGNARSPDSYEVIESSI